MKLIFLYGPPAAGKLTTAKELAAITGYKLFHNHLTVNLAVSLFEFGSEPFLQLLRSVRLQAFEAAAKADLPGLIFTFVYTPPLSDLFVRQVVELAERTGIELCFVHLYCRTEVLEERVVSEDRAGHGKITSVEKLARYAVYRNPETTIPDVNGLSIDNSYVTPDIVARQVIECFNCR
jgi:hypothetical protein